MQPAWFVRTLGVKNLRDVPKTGIRKMIVKRREQFFARYPRSLRPRVSLHVSSDERTHQPGPTQCRDGTTCRGPRKTEIRRALGRIISEQPQACARFVEAARLSQSHWCCRGSLRRIHRRFGCIAWDRWLPEERPYRSCEAPTMLHSPHCPGRLRKSSDDSYSITAIASISIRKSSTARDETPINVLAGGSSPGKNSLKTSPTGPASSGL